MADSHPGQRKFVRALSRITELLGSVPATCAAFVIIVAWFTGSLFVQGHLANDSYQLLINTGTTIITFLMVFIIQNTQNRESRAVQVKLDAVLTNQRTMMEMVSVTAPGEHQEKVEALADELMGLEDEPEKDIKAEQDRVRDA